MVAGLAAAAAFVVLAMVRPRMAVLAMVAFPPGVLASITSSAAITDYLLYAVIAVSVVALLLRRRIGNLWFVSGYGAVLILMGLSVALSRVPGAVGARAEFATFGYYLAVYLLVLNVAPDSRCESLSFARQLSGAILLSVLVTGAIGIVQLGTSYFPSFDIRLFPENAGFMFSRTHFGYLMAVGFAVALARWASDRSRRPLWSVLTLVTFGLVIISMTRGAWAAALVMIVVVGVLNRKWWMLAVVPATGLFALIPAIQSRLASDLQGGALLAIQSGSAGSHRILLWLVLWTVAVQSPFIGQGFGFMSTLSPGLFFGEGQFVTAANPLVYAHNDLLYLMIELGLIGVIPYVVGLTAWWGDLIGGMREVWGNASPEKRAVVLACFGIAFTTRVAQMFDNGFFIRAVFERFAIAAAALWLVRHLPQTEAEIQANVDPELSV